MRRRSVICNRHDVALVPFPFVDLPVTKRRPVVAVSGADFNARNGSTVFAMITTAGATRWPSDVAISDRTSAGLMAPCVVRCRLVTLPNDLVIRQLGALGADDRVAFAAVIDAMMA
jgi:mRNA interferase MazF